MPTAKAKSARKRDAAETRKAILASAQRAFAAHGYAGAGLREIAGGAGVTAMLVNRYFGSKEKLFAEAIAESMADPTVLSAENIAAPDFARAMARSLAGLTTRGPGPLIGFEMMVRSQADPAATAIIRKEIEKHHQATLANAIGGKQAELRAALVLALVAGMLGMRQMVGLKALAKADPDVLAGLIEPLLRQLVEA